MPGVTRLHPVVAKLEVLSLGLRLHQRLERLPQGRARQGLQIAVQPKPPTHCTIAGAVKCTHKSFIHRHGALHFMRLAGF